MWAPWRMAYVSAENGDEFEGPGCVFCDLPALGDGQAVEAADPAAHDRATGAMASR